MTKQPSSPGLRMALDYGPLLVFFAVNFMGHGPAIWRIVMATIAFMVAMVVALAVSWVKTRHVSPMLLVSGVLVIVFGGLTIYFNNPNFIKTKPTVLYGLFAVVLAFGLLTGRPLLEQVLSTAYPGLDAVGWRKLTRNWAIFFVFMAALNEAVWRLTAPAPTDDPAFWLKFKIFGAIPLTLLFAFANVPMLLKHGLTTSGDAVGDVPPEGS